MDAKNGDSRAQRSIYEHLSAKMYAVCLRYMGDKEAAQDVLQDGFVTLFNNYPHTRERVLWKGGREEYSLILH